LISFIRQKSFLLFKIKALLFLAYYTDVTSGNLLIFPFYKSNKAVQNSIKITYSLYLYVIYERLLMRGRNFLFESDKERLIILNAEDEPEKGKPQPALINQFILNKN
jgi:hypothetical protein